MTLGQMRAVGLVVLSLVAIEAFLSSAAFALDKPPLKPDQPSDLVTQSHLSATLRFSASALERELDREVPRRLATFNDRLGNCGHRRVFGRQVNFECVYTGYIERTAPIYLRAEGDRLNAAIKLGGVVEGQGARGFGRLLHGTAEGQMTVYADAKPRLTHDWTLDLNLAEGFRWTDPPELHIFGFTIPIARYVEPQVRAQAGRVEGEVAAKMRAIDVRQKAETAWRRAFEPVQIADNLWLQMSPDAVAFAGIHTRSDILEGAIEFSGPVKTVFSGTAPPSSPTPLAALGTNVAEPGHFEFLVPVSLDYQIIREAVQPIASDAFHTSVQDVDVYPSDGSLIIGVKFATPPNGIDVDSDGWVYLPVRLRTEGGQPVLQLDNPAPASSSSADTNRPSPFADIIRNVAVNYKPQIEKLLQQVNAKLNRDLGNGFRSEGHFDAAGVEHVALLKDSIQLIIRAGGDLAITYAP